MNLEPQVPLNVLNYAAKNQKDPISQVAAMINNSGMNRGQRRRLEKALAKTERLTERAQKRLDRSAIASIRLLLIGTSCIFLLH